MPSICFWQRTASTFYWIKNIVPSQSYHTVSTRTNFNRVFLKLNIFVVLKTIFFYISFPLILTLNVAVLRVNKELFSITECWTQALKMDFKSGLTWKFKRHDFEITIGPWYSPSKPTFWGPRRHVTTSHDHVHFPAIC